MKFIKFTNYSISFYISLIIFSRNVKWNNIFIFYLDFKKLDKFYNKTVSWITIFKDNYYNYKKSLWPHSKISLSCIYRLLSKVYE